MQQDSNQNTPGAVTNEEERGSASPKLRRAAAWLVPGGATILGGAFIILGVSTMWSNQGWLVDIAKSHFAATVGLPAAALVAMAVVLFLEFNAGPIEFEVVGFKFRGASGPVVLWTFCFMAIAAAIKLLW
jgi:hypothetical protein